MTKRFLLASCAVLLPFGGQALAQSGQTAPAAGVVGDQPIVSEIIVTAQKRSESANSVPLSITAYTGDKLRDLGITRVAELYKVTPGLQVTQSAYSTPIYTIRGVGFNESSIGARPTVSVYVDEAPLPFGQNTPIATLDVERVEVLKGPQGTLFGENSTGGAINFIAAKPGDRFAAGLDLTYQRFGQADIAGFVSGPITDTLGVRVALRAERGGAWQRAYTFKGKIGAADSVQGRALFLWQPTDALKVTLNVNRFHDQSDGQAAQFAYLTPLNPTLVNTYFPEYFSYPTASRNNRAADWSPGDKPSRDNSQTQVVLRADYELSDALTLTSLTDYVNYRENRVEDADGVRLQDFALRSRGSIEAILQELRLTGQTGPLRFILGGNYEHDRVFQANTENYADNVNSYALLPFGGVYQSTVDRSLQKIESYAVFANVDYDIAPNLTVHGGVRYTQYNIDFTGCTADPGDGVVGGLFTNFANYLRWLFGQPPVGLVGPGQCITLDPANTPAAVRQQFNQHNVSWRAGLDFKPSPGILLYASVSKGYKAGSYPLLPASVSSQLTPVSQESVLAYEAGFKLSLLDRTLQLNGAGFYYDYRDKQIRAHTDVPIFGQLERLINVPKSRIIGAELQATWVPARGLTISTGGTYIDSKVKRGVGGVFGVFGDPIDIKGEAFPLTPRWQGVADIVYDTPLSGSLDGFFGATLTAQSGTTGGFGEEFQLAIKGYALLDLRAGVHAPDDSWRVWIFGRNVTNAYYWTNADRIGDTSVRFTGRPATYGVTLSLRTR